MVVSSWVELWLYGIYSLFVFFLAFWAPGNYFIRKLKGPDLLERFVLSVGLGICLWGLQGFVFGYLGVRWASWVYLVVFVLLQVKEKRSAKFRMKVSWWLVVLVAGGMMVSLSGVITSGLPGEAIGFYGINPIDGSYHLALIESIIRHFPPEEPGMAGSLVQNYHYWSDLILAELVRVFGLPCVNLFYQYFPILVSILYGLAGYVFVLRLSESKMAARIFVFFMYFAGGLGYLMMLVLSGKLVFSVNSLDNGALLFTNPPRALAQCLLLVGLLATYIWLSKRNLFAGLLAAVVIGILVGVKVYVGIFGCIVLGIVGFVLLYKKEYKQLLPVVLAGVISAIIYFPVNSGAGGIFWSPLSWPRHFFAEGTASSLMWHLQEDEFRVHGNSLRLAILYTQMTAVFLFVVLGTRILGVWGYVRTLATKKNMVLKILGVPMILFVLMSVFFLQQSGPFEIFNFIAVSALIMALFASVYLSELYIRHKYIGASFIIVVLVLAVPRSAYDAKRFWNLYRLKSGMQLEWDEYNFYRQMGEIVGARNVVLTDNSDPLAGFSPYPAAFSGVRLYYSGEGILRAHGLDVDVRSAEVKEVFSKGEEDVGRFMKQKGIDYLMVSGDNGEYGSFDTLIRTDSVRLLKLRS